MHSSSTSSRSDVLCRILRLGGVLALCALAACRPVSVLPQAADPAVNVALEAPDQERQAIPRPVVVPDESGDKPDSSPIQAPRVVTWSARGVSFEGVFFDSRSHRMRVVDQAGGPGSEFASAVQAARSVRGIAAVNAGFFSPEGEPVGLVVSRGKVAGQWNSATSLGSGLWYEKENGDARIARREALGAATARRMPELLQSGPMLVESGRVVRGLHGGEPRPRTLIAWDGGKRWWIGCAAPCAIPEMAAALVSGGGPGFQVRYALNLDGGRSSELWLGSGVSGGPLTRRSLLNRQVRNYLVLVAR